MKGQLTPSQLELLRSLTLLEWTKPHSGIHKKTISSLVALRLLETRLTENSQEIRKTELGEKRSQKRKVLDPTSPTKICPTCGIEKDKETGYTKNRGTPDGYQSACRDCSNAATARWKEKDNNRAMIRATKKAWRLANPESARASVKKCWDKNYDKYKVTGWRWWIKAKYGLTEDDYYEMLEKQDFGCAICGVKEADAVRKRFCVDHCHDTGVVRGLLCFACNVILGNANDSPERLESCIYYLKKFPKDAPSPFISGIIEASKKETL